MKEHDFINIIKILVGNRHIGDDCAYLEDLGIVITQDNFIEDVHFKYLWATPYQIGYKAAIVNISDVLASGAEPKYITVGLSIPNLGENFIKEFYRGVLAGCNGAEIIGGDITYSEKICISITAIGTTSGRKIASRKNAKSGYVVVTKGDYGKSSAGLKELMNQGNNIELITAHLEPKLNPEFSKFISENAKVDYAMMDTSDGLADALFQIAKASNVKIVSRNIEGMFGAEDYNLVAVVPAEFALTIPDCNIIGKVVDYDGYFLEIEGKKYSEYDELNTYNHFGD
ncbi:MAG: hypothetical protein E7Z89_08820 [Cyanobacteria bacterium SIG28]|nr:hypothetical protein [Cyanobacteria bacterium SIG28]